MHLKAYTVRDAKTNIYNLPFFAHTHGEAERTFTDLVNSNEGSKVANWPEDYDLFYLGEYDQKSGNFEKVDTPQHIVKAITVKKTQQ